MSSTLLKGRQRQQMLEAYLQDRAASPGEQPRRGEKRAPGTVVPLTRAEKQLWLHAQLAPDTPLYNEPLTIRRAGPVDVAALERSFTEIVRRHEAWRTAFPAIEGEPMQVIEAPFEVRLPVSDLRNLPPGAREQEARRLATEDAQEPFDLARGPLFRARLIRIDEEDYRLFSVFHHLIFDGFSGYRVFLPELAALYEAFSRAALSPLPELDFQLADYAVWQQESPESSAEHSLTGAAGGETEKDRIDYWKRQLAGVPAALDLAIVESRSGPQSFAGAMHSVQLDAALSEQVRALSRTSGLTMYMTLLAAFEALLFRYSGQEDFVVGSNSAGRNFPGTEKLLGYFLNTIPLRADFSGDPSFMQLAERVRRTTLDALAHDEIALDQLVAELKPPRNGSRNPLFQVLFALEPPRTPALPGWDLTSIEVETGSSKFELCLVLDDRPDGLLCRFIYRTALFDPSAIERMAGHWQTLLAAIAENPGRKISQLPMLTVPERQQLLVEWNPTEAPEARARVEELFAAQARRTPDAPALECGPDRLSYAELNRRADRLAGVLIAMGVGPNQPVALCLERSPEMIVGILGVLKAGGCYVALDPATPRERLEFLIADSGARVLLTQSGLGLKSLSRLARIVPLDQDFPAAEGSQESRDRSLDDLAYILYTSGSTGAPKGVEVTHANLAHSNQARLDYYQDPVGKFLLLSSYSFDSSVAGIFHTLTSGGTLVLPPATARLEWETLSRLAAAHRISHLLTFPSLYAELIDRAPAASLASLRTVIVAGEACPRDLIERHYRVLPQASLYNEYGPTEATVWTTVYACEPGQDEAAVPIGRPIANAQCYVLDQHGEAVPIGIPGELYIGGDGVTRGYRNRPDLTAAAFVPNPFAPDRSARLYRTGDRVRYRADGNLEFLGRADQQVKLHGLRIELGEVEALLGQHPDVREAVVVLEPDAGHGSEGGLSLHAYVVTREQNHTSAGELRSFLRGRLPQSMIPSAFYLRTALPRTPNGKVDRARLSTDRLSAEELSAENSQVAAAATSASTPANPTERRLLEIWQRVFRNDAIGASDDFFALGGHSLLAAELLAGIEKEFSRAFSLAFVFQAPTVEQMAESLERAGQSLRERAIIPIHIPGPGRSANPPLFWIRGGPRFRLLAQKLGPNQPFLGLDLPHWDGSQLPVPYRFEDIAALLVRALQEEQPRGPYFLAGLCVNAVLAYEIARQLRAKGEEVGMLALLDGHNQAYYKNPLTDGRYSGRIKYHLANLLQMGARQKGDYIADRMDEARRKIERMVWQLTSDRRDGSVRNTDNIVHPAFHRYDPQPYPGKMLLLQSSDWPEGPYFDFRLGWEHTVEGIEFHWIPGDHPSMFTEPNVNLVAEHLRASLEIGRPKGGITGAARQ